MLQVRGKSSTISTMEGTLNAAMLPSQYVITSSAPMVAPSSGSTNAFTAWSRMGSGTPMTAASLMLGCSSRMPSISVVEMFSPERLIMLLLRSKKKNQPFSS